MNRDETLFFEKQQIVVHGRSVAGMETCIEVPSHDVMFDVGRVTDTSLAFEHVFISHCHMDHISGIISHACQRNMCGRGPPTYYVPHVVVDAVNRIFTAAETVDGTTIARNVVGVSMEDAITIGQRKIIPIRTRHKIPSRGYKLVESRKRLKPQYEDLKGQPQKIAKLVRAGTVVQDTYQHSSIAYTGDTAIEGIVENADLLADVDVLVTELTFIEPEHIDLAREHRHIHILDLQKHQDILTQKAIVLTHFSARYDREDVRQAVASYLPKIAERVHLL